MGSLPVSVLDRRPIVVALAGPNGAGKTTFYHAHLRSAGLRLVNADVLARELKMDPYAAARVAGAIREELIRQRESFVLETVFSDPVGDELGFLRTAAEAEYTVLLCFIGISGPEVSEERVAMRVLQGGHDVPQEKLTARFAENAETLGILENLRRAMREVPHVWVFDNDDLRRPFRLVAVCEGGKVVRVEEPVPGWLRGVLP
jgi:predicted ABC-type ATPase